jgi:predicted ATP-grasp superfamily ATP-dependent carboligase
MHTTKKTENVSSPPVILLGGLANTTSAIRSFGRRGIPVYVISKSDSPALRSRYITQSFILSNKLDVPQQYQKLLLLTNSCPKGSVLFPCDDASITFVAQNKIELSEKYLLDIQVPQHQLDLLDKQKTLEIARKLGCPAPNFWEVSHLGDIERVISDIKFPVLIKPIHSHIFQKQFGKKLFLAENSVELFELAKSVIDEKIEFMLCEFIPGDDTLLSSYYVYICEDEDKIFEYTKRVIRRSPPNFGAGSYHISKKEPETLAQGKEFFEGMGFKGLGNIEFKFDTRDRRLKIIECNARFTGAQELVTRCGIDMPYLIYDYLCSGNKTKHSSFKENVTLWLPFEDIDAFRELRKLGKITFFGWIKSVTKRQVFSYFSISDPKPFIYDTFRQIQRRITWFLRRVFKLKNKN